MCGVPRMYVLQAATAAHAAEIEARERSTQYAHMLGVAQTQPQGVISPCRYCGGPQHHDRLGRCVGCGGVSN